MRIVLTHPKMGVYLGNCFGLGFWSLLDSGGQVEATTFASEADAREHIESWDENSNPADYQYIPIKTDGYATVADLADAGLGNVLGDMPNN